MVDKIFEGKTKLNRSTNILRDVCAMPEKEWLGKMRFTCFIDRFEQKPTDTCYRVDPSCICGKPHWAFKVNKQKVFEGVEYAEGCVVEFEGNACTGTPHHGELGKEQEIQGMRLVAGTEVNFHSNGNLDSATLATMGSYFARELRCFLMPECFIVPN